MSGSVPSKNPEPTENEGHLQEKPDEAKPFVLLFLYKHEHQHAQDRSGKADHDGPNACALSTLMQPRKDSKIDQRESNRCQKQSHVVSGARHAAGDVVGTRCYSQPEAGFTEDANRTLTGKRG